MGFLKFFSSIDFIDGEQLFSSIQFYKFFLTQNFKETLDSSENVLLEYVPNQFKIIMPYKSVKLIVFLYKIVILHI